MRKMLSDRRGIGAVELLFVVLLLSLLLFGAVEIGRVISLKHSLDVGVARAARGLSISPDRWDWAQTVVKDEVDDNMLGSGYGDQVSFTLKDGNKAAISAAHLNAMSFGQEFYLYAEAPFELSIPFMSTEDLTVSSQHGGHIERYP